MADERNSMVYFCTSLTGGYDNSLDSIKGNKLYDGDMAFALDNGVMRCYLLDADSTSTESSPSVITPNIKGKTKRWILQPVLQDKDLVINVEYYGSLNAAITSIGSTITTLRITTTQTMTASAAIPSTMKVIIEQGGSIITTGYTLTVSGTLEAGPYQIFSGTGTVAGLTEAYPDWWATNTTPGTTNMVTAINAAINSMSSGVVKFLPSIYAVSTTIISSTADHPIILKGAGMYESTKGTRIKWIGGNSDSIVRLSGYMKLKDMFIYNGNSATGLIGVDMLGTVAATVTTNTISRVWVKSCAIGYAFNYAYYTNLYSSAASYCTIGFDLRDEANNINFFGCQISACGTGIAHTGTGNSSQVLWDGGAIESCTAYGISVAVTAPVNAWRFNNPYFEHNHQHKLSGFITIQDAFVNHDGDSGTRPPFDIAGSRQIEIHTRGISTDIAQLFTISAAAAYYTQGGIYVTDAYYRDRIAASMFSSAFLRDGYFDSRMLTVIETAWTDASGALDYTTSVVGERWKTQGRYLVAGYLVVNTAVVVAGGHFLVTYGNAGAGWNQYINVDFTTDRAAGIHELTTTTGASIISYPGSYPFHITGTAETSGKYKVVLIFI